MSEKRLQTDQRWEMQEPHYHVVGRGGQFLVLRHVHAWHPPTDVMADEDRLYINVEIGGMKDGEFQVSVDNLHLTITGIRTTKEGPHPAYHQLEVRYGEFRADVTLPWPVDEDEIVARYEDGFLRVELPRTKLRKIHIVDVEKG